MKEEGIFRADGRKRKEVEKKIRIIHKGNHGE